MSDNRQSQLFSELIHELNQPLTAIKAYLGGCELRLKKNELSSDQISNVLQKISEHTELLGNKIGSMQRITSEREHHTNLHELIAEITSLFSFEIQTYDIKLSLDEHQNHSGFYFNKLQFKLIFFRLFKLCIDTVEKNKIPNTKLIVQTKIHSKNALKIIIKSNFVIKKENLEKELHYCQNIAENCGTISTKLSAEDMTLEFIIFSQE